MCTSINKQVQIMINFTIYDSTITYNIPFKYRSNAVDTSEWYLNGPRGYYDQGYFNGL